MNVYSHINLKYLTKIAGGDNDFFADVIREYLKKVPSDLQKLVDSLTEMNYANMCFYAHKLRSAAQMVGAEELHQKLEQFEHFAADRNDELKLVFKDIEYLNKNVLLELTQELNYFA